MDLVFVTGVSGAGKSTALRALEDIAYYCVDNMPLPLLSSFVELLARSSDVSQAALVFDARAGRFLEGYHDALQALRRGGHKVEVLFLEASDEVLVRRFSETRRRHPLSGEDLRKGILLEREMLRGLREEATAVVDTGMLSVHQLKGVIQERYRRSGDLLGVTLLSFGFKHGLPPESDLVLDVRFLPNPYFVEELTAATGKEPRVSSFVLDNEDAKELLERYTGMLHFLLPRMQKEGKAYLTVAIGCTGGRHRSVAIVEELARRMPKDFPLTVRHRDLEPA